MKLSIKQKALFITIMIFVIILVIIFGAIKIALFLDGVSPILSYLVMAILIVGPSFSVLYHTILDDIKLTELDK